MEAVKSVSIARPIGGKIAAMQQKYFESVAQTNDFDRQKSIWAGSSLALGNVKRASGEPCCICGSEYKHGRKMLFCPDCWRAMCLDCDERHVCTCVAESRIQTPETPHRGDEVKSAPCSEGVKAERSFREVKIAETAPSADEVKAAPPAEELKSSLSAEHLKNAPPAADVEPICAMPCMVAAACQPSCETSLTPPGDINECTLPGAGTHNAQTRKIQAVVLPYRAAMISVTGSIRTNIMFL